MQNKLMLIIIVVLLVVLIGAVATFAFFFLRSSNTEQETAVEPAAAVVHLSEEEITDIALDGALKTNLAVSTDGSEHFISVEISIGVNNTVKKESDSMVALVTEKEKIVRSVALSVLRKKTYQELSRPDGQEILQDEILTKLQEQFNTNLIVRVSAFNMILQ